MKQLEHEIKNFESRSNEYYWIQGWGEQYFSINEKGHIAIRPETGSLEEIDLYELTKLLVKRGLEPPFCSVLTESSGTAYSIFIPHSILLLKNSTI